VISDKFVLSALPFANLHFSFAACKLPRIRNDNFDPRFLAKASFEAGSVHEKQGWLEVTPIVFLV